MPNNKATDPQQMTFFEHLDALRPHIVRSVLAILVLMVAAFLLKDFIIGTVLMGPRSENFPINRLFEVMSERWDMEGLKLNRYSLEMINTAMAGQLNLHFKISFITAISIAVPYTTWELWRFVRPALTANELRGTRLFVFYVSLCFFTGLLFGYFVISPITVNFLSSYTVSDEIVNLIDINSYLSTIVNVSLACAVVFQLPLLIYFLSKMGIVSSSFMKIYRKHAVVVLTIFAALITPPDAFSLILVALPMYLLYELGIRIAMRVEKQKQAEQVEITDPEVTAADEQSENEEV